MSGERQKKVNTRFLNKPMGLRRRILLVTILTMAVLFSMGFVFLTDLLDRSIRSNEKDNGIYLKDLNTLLDSHLSEITLLQSTLRWDEDILSYCSLHENGNSFSKAEAQKALHEKMGLLISANMTFSKLMAVFPDLNTVISGEGSMAYDVFLKYYSIDSDSFEWENGVAQTKVVPAIHLPNGEADYSDPTKYVQLHINQLTSRCYAVVSVSQVRLDNLLSTQFRGKGMDIYVLTADGDIYTKYCSGNVKTFDAAELSELWDAQTADLVDNRKHYDVMYDTVGRLRTVVLFQRSALEQALYRWRLMLGIACLGFLALAVVLYLLLDRWFYRPMKNLLTSYGTVSSGKSEENEYLQISRVMDQMSANITSLEQRMKDEEQKALEQTPAMFLDSESPAGRTPYYAVFTLVFEDSRGVYQHDKCRLFCMTVEKAFPLSVICDHNATFACVIGLADKNAPIDVLRDAVDQLREENDYVRIGLSDVHEASEELYIAYDECRKALNNRRPGLVAEYSAGEAAEAEGHFKVKLAHQVDLARLLSSGDAKQMKSKLDEIYEANSDLNLYWQCRLSRYLLDLLLVLSSGHSTAWLLAMDAREQLASSHNPDLLWERVYTCYEQMCIALQRGDDDLTDRIKRYIEEHLSDPNLTLNNTADAVGRSYSYISAFFSKTVGVSFSEYLQKRRIAVAMRLLAETNEPVAKIAASVGYEVPSSFIRLFKKETSMTPGQYRDTASRIEEEKQE